MHEKRVELLKTHDHRGARKSFTLIELLLLIGLTILIAGLSLPFYSTFVVRNYLKTTSSSLVQTIEKAQNFAQSGRRNAQWGVYINAPHYILFKGTNYAGRDTAFDEVYDIPQSVNVSGISEITFDHIRGETANTGSITLSVSNGDTVVIQIDSSGIQSVQ